MKLVLACRSPATKNYLGQDDCSIHEDLESATSFIQDEGESPSNYCFYDIEVGVPIEFEMKPLRKEVPVRKVK